MTTGSIAFRADETRDRRTDTIGSDHEFSRKPPLLIMTIFEAPHRSAVVGAGAIGSDNDDVEIDGWGSDEDNIGTTSDVASRVQLGNMSSDIDQIWPGGIPRVGQVAERSRTVNAKDIERHLIVSTA
jgi:hypothetical protein